jgi:rSAM/selenodomain-associated transferase 2
MRWPDPMFSIVVPVLDEAAAVARAAPGWARLRAAGHEVLVVDGGSEDASRQLAAAHADRVLVGPRGRARQMNAGAAAARGAVLLFLHVDTVLPAAADALMARALASRGAGWGRFDARIDDPHPAFRVIETMMNWRSALTGIATGDQAMFVDRGLFEGVGGFPDIALMEDLALSRALRARSWPARLRPPVRTSARRWRRGGIVRTVLLMWRLRLAYALGADPARLARRYDGVEQAGVRRRCPPRREG